MVTLADPCYLVSASSSCLCFHDHIDAPERSLSRASVLLTMYLTPRFVARFGFLILLVVPLLDLGAADWSIPVGGNAYCTVPGAGGNALQRSGLLSWSDATEVHSVFFRVDRPATIEVAIKAKATAGTSSLNATINGKRFEKKISGADEKEYVFGEIDIDHPGYVQVDLQGSNRSGKNFGVISQLLVSSDTESLVVDYVKTSQGGMFYWGRRGPSVHLRYQVPGNVNLKYAYSEITVPKGRDPIGSYYMANGFGQGYFGIQVNSERERRILFSVWSPFKTDNPAAIPIDQRISDLGHGEGVHVGKFGNEGSGGQSYLVFPWKAGVTYCFLTEVKPDGNGNTIYTSWFREKKAGDWRLIASFRRPKTNTHLTGFHSFLESFSPNHGYLGRGAMYGNVWVRDESGRWYECTKARFSVDATGGGRHRLDFDGGVSGNSFFMRNCGFSDETGTPGEWFQRGSTSQQRPQIDVDDLPRD